MGRTIDKTKYGVDRIRAALVTDPEAFLHAAPATAIDAVIDKGTLVEYEKNETVFHEGDPASWFYVLIDGVVATVLHDTEIRSLPVGSPGGLTSAFLYPGSKDTHSRSMSHIARHGPAVLLQAPHWLYETLLERHDFALHAVRYLNRHIRQKTSVLALLVTNGNDTQGTEQRRSGDVRIAVFDAKPYDEEYMTKAFAPSSSDKKRRFALKYLEAKLNRSTVGLAAGCDAVCIFVNDRCDGATLLGLHSAGIRLVLLRCAGFNNVDLKAAARLGIAVLRVPAYSPNAVAEHAFALLATVNRKTNRAYTRVRDGNFSLAGLVGRDLNGLTAGVIGCGNIGKCFIDIAKGAGMHIVVYDARPEKQWLKERGVELAPSIDALFAKCDIVSLHVPLFPDTHHLVNAARLKLMPKGGIILNTSRGGLVDGKALIDSLISGHTGGAGLDVYEDEADYFFEDRSDRPIADPVLARLVNLPNVVVTSHQAFLTDKALSAIAQTTLQNATSYFDAATAETSNEEARRAAIAKLANSVQPRPESKL